jgi:hypothetical protein
LKRKGIDQPSGSKPPSDSSKVGDGLGPGESDEPESQADSDKDTSGNTLGGENEYSVNRGLNSESSESFLLFENSNAHWTQKYAIPANEPDAVMKIHEILNSMRHRTLGGGGFQP